MKTKPGSTFAIAAVVLIQLLTLQLADCAPRPPQPPWPQATLRIYGFDSAYAKVPWRQLAVNEAEAAVTESWSGYSLSREGLLSAPVVIPVRASEKELNIAPSRGSIRFWFAPNWSTASEKSGGKGPGHAARLLEMVNVTGKAQTRWSLFLNDTGDTLSLAGETKPGATVLLKAPVEFTAGDWRMISLLYSETDVILQLDTVEIAKGEGLLAPAAWEEKDFGLVVGSDVWAAMDSVAEGQFEELTMLAQWPKQTDWQEMYFKATKRRSLLGPMGTKEEEQAKIATLKAAGLLPEDYGVAAKSSGEGDGPMAYSYAAGTLWLEIISVTNAQANLTVHGTVSGQDYAILSKRSLTNTAWVFEQVVVGSPGQDWAPAFAPVADRTNELFFWAVSLGDADADGLPDFWELEQGLNPNDAADGNADPDGDGYTNLDEFLLGQDPHVADPPRPTITIAATDASAGEPNNPGTLTLTRTGVTTRALTAYYTVYGSARAGTDYQALSGQALFAIGQSTTTVTVQPVDDQSYEGTEDVTLQILPSVHYLNATNALATVTIADNEVPPIRVWASSDVVVEGSGTNGAFNFLREGDTRLPLTVNFTLTGTATNGVIYQTLPTAITFAAGDNATNLTVIPINNTNYSGSTTGIVTLLPNAAYLIATNAGSDELVFGDDDLPVANIVATDADAREAGLNPGRFTVSRTGATQEALAVYYRVSGTAEMGSPSYPGDYQALTNVVVIPTGQGNAFVDINPVQDTNSEPMETVILTLAGSENYRIGVSNSATVNIDDNEPLTYVVTVERPSIINAGTRPGIIHITRTGSALAASSLAWSVTDTNGTSQFGNYTLAGDFLNGSLYFAPNRATATVNLQHTAATIPALQFRFAGRIATVPCWGAERLIQIQALGLNSYSTEGDPGTKARFSVSRGANGPGVQVKLRLEGTATPGADFPATNLQTITFGDFVTSQTLEVFAYQDGVTEGWESLIVRLDTSDLTYAPYNSSVSATDFQETYAVLWLGEYGTPNPKPEVDTDGDLLTDTFEVAHGMNPLIADDYQTDADKDGLSLVEEQYAGTNPALADSDGDTVNDFLELSRGSNPTNAQNVAVTPPAGAKVTCLVGDDSGSTSERWQMIVGNFTVNNAAPGQVITRTITLKEGTSNVIRLRHLSSILTPPDLDYRAELLSGDAAPPAFFVRDPQQLLGNHSDPGDGPAYTNKTAVVMVPKVELTWTNKGDNLVLDMNTNGSSGEVRGQRIFVGAKTPTENLARNTVLIKIKTTPPLAGSNVWVRSFDVDDTTPDRGVDNEGVIDTNGRFGEDNFSDYLNTPKAGLFVGSGTASFTTNLNASGEAFVEFRVGMQPGNNYRLAATVFPTNNLSALQTATPTDNGFVSAYTDWIRGGFNGKLSPLLTVWRKLHLEIDSMTAPPTSGPQANFLTMRISAIKTNTPDQGQTAVYLRFSNQPWQDLYFENGTLTIPTLAINQAIIGQGADHVWQFNDYHNYVIVPGNIPLSAVGAECQLRDDDDRFKAELQLPSLPMDGLSQQIISGKSSLVHSTNKVKGVAAVYLPAFIQVVDANQLGWNTSRTIPFFLNKDIFDNPLTLSGVFDSAKNIFDSTVFWAHTATMGYQPDRGEDRDNNDEGALLGATAEHPVTSTAFGYSAIYVETIRDAAYELYRANQYFASDYDVYEKDYYGLLFGTIAHETGHAPGKQDADDDHNEGSLHLMQVGAASISVDFAPKTIKRFRSSSSWTGGLP